MIRWAFFAARAAVAGVFLLTWGYGLVVSVPFAFDMFIRPQLFPWLAQFVDWHHVWYWRGLPGECGHVDSASPGPLRIAGPAAP